MCHLISKTDVRTFISLLSPPASGGELIIDRPFPVDVASTSPPNSAGFISTSVSSTNSALNDYEVEVVEIRVQDGDLDHIIP